MGKLIVDEFYDGDIVRWQSRDPKKDLSFRKLAQHPSLPMSAGALCRSLAIFELTERLGIRAWNHVCMSHLRLVLPCPADAQKHLLERAEANHWTVRQLDEHVRVVLDGSTAPQRGGRKRSSTLRKTIRALHKCAAALEVELAGDDELSPESARTTMQVLQRAAGVCRQVEDRVRRGLSHVESGRARAGDSSVHDIGVRSREPMRSEVG